MIVYHGSYIKIETIDFFKCRRYRDFGQGFYVTKILEQAEFWAERKGRLNKTKGYVTNFEFIETAFDNWEFHTLRFADYSREWLDFVVMNRNTNNPTPTHNYDIVEGPIADDDITQRIDDYIAGLIPQSDFLSELKFRQPSHQICFCTHRSLQALRYIDKQPQKRIDTALVTSLISDLSISEEKAIDLYFTSTTYQKLTDKSTGYYLKPQQEIYAILIKELQKQD